MDITTAQVTDQINSVIKIAPEGTPLDASKLEGRKHRALLNLFLEFVQQEVGKRIKTISLNSGDPAGADANGNLNLLIPDASKFKGEWIAGLKKAGDYYVTSLGIWKVLQDFNSATEPTVNNAYWNLVFAGGGDSLPDQTGNAGKALITNGLEVLWQAITATAGGTTEGALQYRNAAGQVTGTDLLRWLNGILTLGSTGNPGKFEIIASESTIEAQDGQTLTILLNTNLDNALEIKDKDTEALFFKVRTKTNDEAIVTTKAHDVDALIGAPHKVRQGYVTTAATAKAYFQIPNTATDIIINMEFSGNIVKFKGQVIGVPDSGNNYISTEFDSTFARSGTIVSEVGATGLTIKEPLNSGVTAGLEVTGTADGLRVFVQPGVADAYTWYLTSSYMKI